MFEDKRKLIPQKVDPIIYNKVQKKMIVSTSNYIFTKPDKSLGQKLNSFKLDFNSMAFAQPSSQPFTECQHCKAILIDQDISVPVKKNEKGHHIWLCRFCKRQNISQCMNFVPNNYKFAIEKNLKTKITPPIILFMIDNSGSMYQSIFHNMKYGSNPHIISEAKKSLHTNIIEIILQSTLYKQEKEMLNKIQSSFTHIVKNAKYSQEEISKIVLLYAVIEHNLKMLTQKSKKIDYRVGFIFFSDMVYVLKGARQKEIPVYVQQGELCHEEWPYKKQSVDFYKYEDMYKTGRKYQKYFGDSRIQKFDVSKIAVSKVKGGGRTALGPALSLAMGIISMHDQGSRIIVATDSNPNFGVLSVGDAEEVYTKIGTSLEQNNASLSILQWSGDELVKSKEEEAFVRFKQRYQQHVDQIQLNITKCKGVQSLELSFLSLNKLINRQPIGHSCEIKIHSDNPKIMPQNLPFKNIDYSSIRFLHNSSKNWLALNIKPNSLQEYDYLFPIITQTITIYSDFLAKEKYIFMSYIKQNLSDVVHQGGKGGEGKEELGEDINMDNMNQLCDLELNSVFEKTRFGEDMQEYKTTFRYKEFELQRDYKEERDITFYRETQEDQKF